MLQPTHVAQILALAPSAASAAWTTLAARYPSFGPPPTTPPDEHTAEALLDRITVSRLDHAAVVVPLCRRAPPSTLETLIGHPITRLAPRGSARPRHAPRPRSPTQVSAAASDTRTVLSVVPNPKKPGTASHQRFEAYVVGETVAAAASRGLTTADLKWDLERGFLTLGV